MLTRRAAERSNTVAAQIMPAELGEPELLQPVVLRYLAALHDLAELRGLVELRGPAALVVPAVLRELADPRGSVQATWLEAAHMSLLAHTRRPAQQQQPRPLQQAAGEEQTISWLVWFVEGMVRKW